MSRVGPNIICISVDLVWWYTIPFSTNWRRKRETTSLFILCRKNGARWYSFWEGPNNWLEYFMSLRLKRVIIKCNTYLFVKYIFLISMKTWFSFQIMSDRILFLNCGSYFRSGSLKLFIEKDPNFYSSYNFGESLLYSAYSIFGYVLFDLELK